MTARRIDAPLRERTRFAFLWIALVPMMLAVTAVWLSREFRHEVAWIAHTYEVRTEVREVFQQMMDAEDSLAQYYLTGKEQYARAMDSARNQALARLERLRDLTSDNPVQQKNIAELAPRLRQALSEIESARLQKVPNQSGTFPADINELGQQSMRRIRAVVRDMMQEEERLLVERTASETRTSREVETIFVAAVLLTLALLLLAGRRMRDYAKERDLAESKLQSTVSEVAALNRDLEVRVEERTSLLRDANAELARSNEDLERFAFIASHDLQEPLRVVTLYSQLLAKSLDGSLDKQAVNCIEIINESTGRMLDLLRSLLTYAEMGMRPDQATGPANLNVALAKALNNLKAAIEESGAVITSDPLPVLRVNEGHFIQLFQNLVGNSIKYRGDRPPNVQISAKEIGANIQFSVMDNGVGIEPQYHEKVFVAFKRLHGKNIPGAGIGLAICRRALDRYAGRIWVESQANGGATFIFTVPSSLKCADPPPAVQEIDSPQVIRPLTIKA